MAFTEAQRVQIRKWIGHSDLFQDRNSRLEDAMDVVGARPDTKTEVEAILAALSTVDSGLTTAQDTAGLKRAEDIEWYQGGSGGSELEVKERRGRQLVGRLSTLFGVPILSDAFGEGGYRGDDHLGVGFQYGGPFPLG